MSSSTRPRSEDTRRSILDAAYQVFVTTGYKRATLATMAEMHLISLRRFKKYFSERSMDTISSWRSWVELNANLTPSMLVFPSDSYRFPAVTPAGQDAIYELEEVLANAIADDLGVSRKNDLRPTLVACALWAGNAHVAQSWAGKRMDKKKLVASLLEVVAKEGSPSIR